jgi:hypothetical protein
MKCRTTAGEKKRGKKKAYTDAEESKIMRFTEKLRVE